MDKIKKSVGTMIDKIKSFFIFLAIAIKFIVVALGGLTILAAYISSGIFAVTFIFVLMYLYSAFVSAFVVSHLWLWFVVPIFKLSTLTFPQAFGLSLLLNYWTYHHFSQHIKDERTWKQKMPETIGLLLRPWWILLVGWICFNYFIN